MFQSISRRHSTVGVPGRSARRRLVGAVHLAVIAVAVSACGSEPAPPATVTPAPPPQTATSAAANPEPPATLSAPQDGATVQKCAVFEGASNLQPGQTIVLGMKNLTNGDPEHYYETVKDWEYADQQPTWKGYQWFGSDVNQSKQDYRVDVLVVPVDVVTAALAESKRKDTFWHSPTLPKGARLAAQVTVHRVPGAGPAECR